MRRSLFAKRAAGAGVGLAVLALAMPAQAQQQSVEDFYKGKTINFIIGYSPGRRL